MPPLNRRAPVEQRIQAPALQVASIRGSTYAQPAQVKQGPSGLDQLLGSLDGLGKSIGGIMEQREKKRAEKDSLAAETAFQGMTLEQAREMVASKKINEHESPYFRAAFLARLGQNEAAARKRDLVSRFETDFDKINGNADAWVREQSKADLDRLPKNDFVRKAYLAEMDGFAAAIAGKQVDAQVEEIRAAREVQGKRSLHTAAQNAEELGLAVEEPEVEVNITTPAPVKTADDKKVTSAKPMTLEGLWRGYLKRVEGGYVAQDGKSGAPANFGINQRANPDIDVKNLTEAKALELYRDRYWKASGADKLTDPALQAVHMDTAVNMGVGAAQSMIAKAGNDPAKYLALREARYKEIGGKDLPAWLERNKKLAAFVGNPSGMDVGDLDFTVIPAADREPRRLKDPNGFAAKVFETIEENAATNLATRREQEQWLIAMMGDMANAGKDAQVLALLDFNRGPAGTLREKLGPKSDLLVDLAKTKRETKEDTAAAGRWEQLQFQLGVKAENGTLTDEELEKAKEFGLDSRVRAGRRPLAEGEYFAGLIARRDNYLERQAEKARREAEEAARLAAEATRQQQLEHIFNEGLGHELEPEDASKARDAVYGRNRQVAGADHVKRRALDLQAWKRSGVASPYSGRLLANGIDALRTGVGVTPDGAISAPLALGLQEFEFYRRHAPNALPQIIRPELRKHFDTWALLKETGFTDRQAALQVQRVVSGEIKPAAATAAQRGRIRQIITDKGARAGALSGWASWATFGALDGILYADSENDTLVVKQTEQRAAELMAAGVPAEGAVAAAISHVASNWTQVDGVLVHHNGTPVPNLFEKGIVPALQHHYETKLKGTAYHGPKDDPDKWFDSLVGWARERIYVERHPTQRGSWLIFGRDDGRAVGILTTKDVQDAVVREANKLGLLDKAAQVGRDVIGGDLVKIRRKPNNK